MVKVRKVTINRAEGPTKLLEDPRTVPSFDEADLILRNWAFSAPKDGSYDKVDVRAAWADGETFNGRYDLTHADVSTADLAQHVRQFFRFYGGLWKPPAMSDFGYETALKRAERHTGIARDVYAAFLQTHEI